MKSILKTEIITILSVVFFCITNQANAGLLWQYFAINHLLDDCYNYRLFNRYHKALQVGLEAIRIDPAYVWSYVCVAKSEMGLWHYHQAIRYLNIAKQYATTAYSLSSVYNLEGFAYEFIGDLNRALLYDKKGLSFAVKSLHEKAVAIDLNNVGTAYFRIGKLDKALKFYKNSLSLANTYTIYGIIPSTIYNNIAMVYYKKGNYKKAIEYVRKAIKTIQIKDSDNNVGLAISYLHLGNIYVKIKDFQKAKKYLEQGYSMEKNIVGNLRWLGTAHRYLGNLYFAEGERTLAKENWEKALKYYLLTGYKLGTSIVTKRLNEEFYERHF